MLVFIGTIICTDIADKLGDNLVTMAQLLNLFNV